MDAKHIDCTKKLFNNQQTCIAKRQCHIVRLDEVENWWCVVGVFWCSRFHYLLLSISSITSHNHLKHQSLCDILVHSCNQIEECLTSN